MLSLYFWWSCCFGLCGRRIVKWWCVQVWSNLMMVCYMDMDFFTKIWWWVLGFSKISAGSLSFSRGFNDSLRGLECAARVPRMMTLLYHLDWSIYVHQMIQDSSCWSRQLTSVRHISGQVFQWIGKSSFDLSGDHGLLSKILWIYQGISKSSEGLEKVNSSVARDHGSHKNENFLIEHDFFEKSW